MGKGGGSIRHGEKLALILVLIDRNCEEIEGDSQLQLCLSPVRLSGLTRPRPHGCPRLKRIRWRFDRERRQPERRRGGTHAIGGWLVSSSHRLFVSSSSSTLSYSLGRETARDAAEVARSGRLRRARAATAPSARLRALLALSLPPLSALSASRTLSRPVPPSASNRRLSVIARRAETTNYETVL